MWSEVSLCGPCEWCGGPQSWTVIAGEVYTSCDGGCLPLPLEGLVPPPDSPELEKPVAWVGEPMEPEGEGGVVPPEGSEAKTSDTQEPYELPF